MKKLNCIFTLRGQRHHRLLKKFVKVAANRYQKFSIKSGNYNWQNFDQFLHIYEVVTNLFLKEENFEALIRHVLDKQVGENVIYTEIFLGPHLWSERPSERWERFLNIAKNVADEYKKNMGFTPTLLSFVSDISDQKRL